MSWIGISRLQRSTLGVGRVIAASGPRTNATGIGKRQVVRTRHSNPSGAWVFAYFLSLQLTKILEHKHCLQPGCDFDGLDQHALNQHLKQDHFQCEGCKLILPSHNKLNLHYETCSFALRCPQCGEEHAGKARLALHLEHCYLCDECGFQTHHEAAYEMVRVHCQCLSSGFMTFGG